MIVMAHSRFTDPIEPMDLANVRANGVRWLAVLCPHSLHLELRIAVGPQRRAL
jgi:hypothetical protein